jgi:hypothetical protein
MNWSNAFFVTMFGVGCLSSSFTAIVLARALYLDLRRLMAKRRWRQKRAMVRRIPGNVIGFSPNRRRNAAGFVEPN